MTRWCLLNNTEHPPSARYAAFPLSCVLFVRYVLFALVDVAGRSTNTIAISLGRQKIFVTGDEIADGGGVNSSHAIALAQEGGAS